MTTVKARPMSRAEMLAFIASKRGDDPVYWDAMKAMMGNNFQRPDDSKYKTWLKEQRYLNLAFLGTGVLDEEWAWRLTDAYVVEAHGAECYPVFFGLYGPVRGATPNILERIRQGHLLLGFITEQLIGKWKNGEPKTEVDKAFVLPCWNAEEVEPLLRGCFLL